VVVYERLLNRGNSKDRMNQFFLYSSALAGYAFLEYYFKFRYKTLTRNKQFDITLYLITVPFSIMAMIPIWFLMKKDYEPGSISLASFLGIFTVGAEIRGMGRNEIGSLFSGKIELSKEHCVVKTGIYRYLRHPLYLGSSLMAIGIELYCVNLLSMLMPIHLLTSIDSKQTVDLTGGRRG
jgi:protein-S-isoprenylcysteine O-methyltransferase